MPADTFLTIEQNLESMQFLGKLHAISFVRKIMDNFDWNETYADILDQNFNKKELQKMLNPYFNNPAISILNLMDAVLKEKKLGNPLLKDVDIHSKYPY